MINFPVKLCRICPKQRRSGETIGLVRHEIVGCSTQVGLLVAWTIWKCDLQTLACCERSLCLQATDRLLVFIGARCNKTVHYPQRPTRMHCSFAHEQVKIAIDWIAEQDQRRSSSWPSLTVNETKGPASGFRITLLSLGRGYRRAVTADRWMASKGHPTYSETRTGLRKTKREKRPLYRGKPSVWYKLTKSSFVFPCDIWSIGFTVFWWHMSRPCMK